jgi:hypothetical protein
MPLHTRRTQFKDVGKGWYSLAESRQDTYNFSKLKKFMVNNVGKPEILGAGRHVSLFSQRPHSICVSLFSQRPHSICVSPQNRKPIQSPHHHSARSVSGSTSKTPSGTWPSAAWSVSSTLSERPAPA